MRGVPQTPSAGASTQGSRLAGRMRQVYYGWWMVGISGFVMAISSVPLFHAMSVWAVALEHQFGWNRTQLGFAFTFTRIEGGFMGPVEGYLTDRVGTRRMVFIGLLVFGAGFLFFGQVQNLWMFYLAYVVMALGQGLGGWLPLMTLLNHWFERRRATAIGWANMGNRAGALLLLPTIAWAIDPNHDRLGWQLTATIIGVFALVVALPVSRLIRNRPPDSGIAPAAAPVANQDEVAASGIATSPTDSGSAGSPDMTASQALRTPAFWLISFGHGFTSMIILAVLAHLGLMLADKGYDLQTTAWIVNVYLGVSMLFQVAGGYLGDRVPKGVAVFAFATIQAAAVVVLTSASNLYMLYIFAILFGIGMGGRSPLTVAIRGEYFGRSSFGRILGLSTVPMNLLLLGAAPFAGYMRDVQGTYDNAFLILAGLNFLGGVLFLLAKKPKTSAPTLGARVAQAGN